MWKFRKDDEATPETKEPKVVKIDRQPMTEVDDEMSLADLTPEERKLADAYFTRPVEPPKEPVDPSAPKGFGDLRVSKHI